MQRAESDSELYSTARSPLFSEYLGEKEIFCKTNFACLPGAYVGLINEMKIGQNFFEETVPANLQSPFIGHDPTKKCLIQI